LRLAALLVYFAQCGNQLQLRHIEVFAIWFAGFSS